MTEAIVHWKLVATGKVQMVNYRERVEREAGARHIVGTVENDPKDRHKVYIDAQGDLQALDAFRKAISTPEGDGRPREVIRTEEGPPDPSLTDFEILYGDSPKETVERVNFAGQALTGLRSEVRTGFESLGRKVDAGNKVLGEKFDRGNATLGNKVDGVARAVREGNSTLGRKVDTVAASVRLESRSNAEFRHELAGAVRLLDTKYGAVGRTLSSMQKDLGTLARATERQARSTDRQAAAILRLAKAIAGGSAPRSGRRTNRR